MNYYISKKYFKFVFGFYGLIVFLISIAVLFPTRQAFCNDTGIVCTGACVNGILSDIEQHMKNIKTVQALFVEKKHMSMFDMPVIIKGRIYIENPDKFAWMVTSPVAYTLIINKNTIKKWDKSGGLRSFSLKKNPMFKAVIDHITFWFSGSYKSCRKDYKIELVKKEPAIIRFIPRKNNPASRILAGITLFFLKDKRYISKIRLLEKNTDSTELFFKDVKINSPIDKSVWEINK